MKRVFGVLSAAVLLAGLLLPGVPILAQEQRGTVEGPAVSSEGPSSGRLAADIEELKEKADEEGRVTVVIKLAGPSLSGVAPDRVVGELKRQTARSQERVLRFLEARGATVLNTFWLTNAVLAEVPAGLLDEFDAFTEVERLLENFTMTSPEPSEEEDSAGTLEASYTWGLEKIRAPRAWDELGVTGSGVRVAVLDTGVDAGHPDLAGKMWTDSSADAAYPGGWIEFDGSGNIVAGSTPHDTHGHGTHCSGTVLGGSASGVAIGVAPDAWLMHGLILPGGGGTFTQVIAGMQWTIDPVDQYGNPAGEPADVISMSLGATGYYDVMREPVQNIRAAGTVPVLAIGNDGEGKSTSPGNVRESFAIGATNIGDNVALFSSGDVLDLPPEPYIKPDFSAPGVNVYSALPYEKYGYYSGTSMATPHAAGAVALIREANPAFTVDEIYEILRDTSLDLGDPGQDIRYGWGRIDAFDAVAIVLFESGIEGFVRDAETDEALDGASVFISETNAMKSTDVSGYYRFFLAPGIYTLNVGGFGYYEQTATVEVVDGCITQDFLLEPLPAGFMAGTVTDAETGEPVAGTGITVFETPLRVTTDESGQYSLKVPAGAYDVNAWAWRYRPSLASGVAVLEDETVTVDFALEPGLAAVVVGDYYSQLTNLLMASGISTEEKTYLWEATWSMARYDVVVVNRPQVYPSEGNFLEFLEAASDHRAGVVFTSCFPSYHQSYGITFLQMYLNDPEEQDHGSGDGYVYYRVTQPSPIFEGWEVGETVTVIKDSEGGQDYHAWFRGYSGQAIAEVGSQKTGIRGEAVALGQYGDSLHVLLAGLGPRQDTDLRAWTEDGKTIFVNAVLLAGGVLDTGLVVVNTDLPAGVVGVAYQATLEAAGGSQPYTWAVVSGALPDGLGLDADTGVISGTPAAVGNFGFTVQVTDAEEGRAAADLSVTVMEPLEIITAQLPAGTEGVAYQATLEAAGGIEPYTWTLTEGSLPDGLGLEAAAGFISGIPTAAGTFYFDVQAMDSTGDTAWGELSITIETGPLVVITANLPEGRVEVAYQATLEAAGGLEPYSWAVVSGALPDGLGLDADTGIISGTPSTAGTFDFTVRVTDDGGDAATADLSIIIVLEPLEIITTALPGGEEGVAYQATLEAAGGLEPYTWAITEGSLPDGLGLEAESGVISSTPGTAGTFYFTVRVTDNSGDAATAELSISIAAGPLKIITTELPDGQEGMAYQATLEATGGTKPYTWAIVDGALPTGLELSADTGIISGTPAAAGTFPVRVRVTDSTRRTPATATADLSISILAEPLEIVTTGLPDGQVGVGYEATLEAAGGIEPYTWAIADGALPDGLELDADTGVISGSPTAADSFNCTARVIDTMENTAARAFELTISDDSENWLVNLTLATDPHIGTVPGVGYDFAFGVLEGASEGYDEAEGDQLAPGDPVAGVNAYFCYPDNRAGQRNLVTSVVGPAARITWPLLVKSLGDPGDTQATLTWDGADITNVPGEYVRLELRDSAGNTLADMRSAGSYTFSLQSGETRHFHVMAAGGQVEFVYDLKAGWNMVSLPLYTEETSPAGLFPGHGALYAWDPVALSYYVPSELAPGEGYSVLYFSDTTVPIHGVPVEQYQLVDATAGAHLIGSLEVDAQVTVTEGSVYHLFYWWNPETLSHEATDTLQPGRGYWLLGLTDFSVKVEAEPL